MSETFLIPGRNCWSLERAERVAVIQDGEDYYRLFRDAVLAAERSVFILAWDITGGTNLVPKEPAGTVPARLDAFLRFAAKRKPNVEFLILTWDYGLLFTMERDPFTRWRLGWRTPRNVRLGFDDHHPVGACHHQKIVVVDDSLAFSGSMDLTGHRWDTPQHLVDDPARLDPRGRPYDPYHEVQVMLEGAAAAKLGELARTRWRAAGAKRVPEPAPLRSGLWPQEVAPDFTNVDVAFARTLPRSGEAPGAKECEAMYFDAIARAKRRIYLENQYFTHPGISDALAARLGEPDGPEIVVVVPRGGDGWLDRNTITVIRDTLFRQLQAADVHHRLRLLHPIASRARDVHTFIHSKVLVIDDDLVIVGSANTNRRSMGMDTECDVVVEARNTKEAQAIATIRDRLIAEHVGMTAAEVGAGVTASGSLGGFIDQREAEDRSLAPFVLAPPDATPIDPNVQYVVDPDRPMNAGADLDAMIPAPEGETARVPLRVWISPIVAFLAATFVVWSSAASFDRPGLNALQAAVEAVRRTELPHLGVVAAFLVAGLVLIPLELAVVATGAALGIGRGLFVAVAGSLTLAIAGYAVGGWLGPTRVRAWVTRKSYRAVQQLGARGTIGVAMLRLAGVASAGAVHLLAGAFRIRFAPYMTGTAVGLLPSVVALTMLGGLLGNTIIDPSLRNASVTALAALAVLGAALGLRILLLVRQFGPALARQRTRTETEG